MKPQARKLGKTQVSTSYPRGLMFATGTRLLCADGVIRAPHYLANTPDTFFSTPASVRIRRKTITGYMSVDEAYSPDYKITRRVFTFHPHTESNAKAGNPLPGFPDKFTPQAFALFECGEETR